MNITKLELKNFKRFDDLTIDMTALLEPAKLVLLIGTNGSGKSSVFDAFERLNKTSRNLELGSGGNSSYYKKKVEFNYSINVTINSQDDNGNFIQIKTDSVWNNSGLQKNSFYGRTSVRQVPRLTRTSLGQTGVSFEDDSDRPSTFVDRDNRFENDIDKVTSLILTDVFNGDTSTNQIKDSYVNPINKAFEHIFGNDDGVAIKVSSIKPPLEGKTAEIIFLKGNSKIPYDYLSSGEKEIFNILLDLLVRKEYFKQTIYFLDEIDLHLNTYIQKNLIKEITENWIPDDCQLWTASHSLGFIEYASEAEHATIIDFDNFNFDIPQVIYPSQKNTTEVFEIAVSKEFLAKVVDGKKIFFSENTDTPLYNNLSAENIIFFNAKDKADVFYKAMNNVKYNGLIDRDYLADDERNNLINVYKNLYVLDYYSIENYLFHPENLEEYYSSVGKTFSKEEYQKALVDERKAIRDKLLMGVSGARGGYPFFKENEHNAKLKDFKSNGAAILDMFDNADFETFYKVFPAKDYGTEIRERQNLNRIELAKTKWFKSKIEMVLEK